MSTNRGTRKLVRFAVNVQRRSFDSSCEEYQFHVFRFDQYADLLVISTDSRVVISRSWNSSCAPRESVILSSSRHSNAAMARSVEPVCVPLPSRKSLRNERESLVYSPPLSLYEYVL